jgi:hypothetical protein
MDRPCDGCTVCCIVPPIRSPAFSKQSNTRCQHCTEPGGCGIYLNRPQPCRDFECGWRSLSFLDDRWKPDRCGIMIVPEEDNVPPEFQRRQGLNFIAFRKAEDLEQPFVIEMLAGLAHAQAPIFLSVPGPPGFHPAMILLNPQIDQAARNRDGARIRSALLAAYASLKAGKFEPIVF